MGDRPAIETVYLYEVFKELKLLGKFVINCMHLVELFCVYPQQED